MSHGNQKQKPRLLIVGAFAPEIDRLAAADPREFDLLEAGIGSVAAAVSLQARLLNPAAAPVSEVLFLGSAGVYDPAAPAGPGAFGFSTGFCKRDLATLEGRAHAPGTGGEIFTTEVGERGAAMRAAVEASKIQDGVTNSTDSVSLVQVEVSDCAFENLEAFGVAWVCRRYAVPFGAFFALTNSVGPEGSEQWRANYREMSLELQGFAVKSLSEA
ncbi:MAG: hypothetical protein RIF32_05390 [Leptospirales bacterium]|jgi:nucleoside phosphorylase